MLTEDDRGRVLYSDGDYLYLPEWLGGYIGTIRIEGPSFTASVEAPIYGMDRDEPKIDWFEPKKLRSRGIEAYNPDLSPDRVRVSVPGREEVYRVVYIDHPSDRYR